MGILILKTIGFYVAMLFVGANLIGFFIRSLSWRLSSTEYIKPEDLGHSHETELVRPGSHIMIRLFGFFIITAYLFALFYWGNLLLSIAGLIIMLCRLPDLILEMKTGRKFMFKFRPKGAVYTLSTVALIGVIVLVWFALSM
jgi:hypothetical protein